MIFIFLFFNLLCFICLHNKFFYRLKKSKFSIFCSKVSDIHLHENITLPRARFIYQFSKWLLGLMKICVQIFMVEELRRRRFEISTKKCANEFFGEEEMWYRDFRERRNVKCDTEICEPKIVWRNKRWRFVLVNSNVFKKVGLSTIGEVWGK